LFDLYHEQFPKKPIHIMSNGVEADWFKLPIIANEPVARIVFLGALNRKSILDPLFDVLPDIIKKIPAIKVLIIGDGKFLPYFKQKSDDLKLGNNIFFTGWLELADARKNLYAGDIGYNYMPNEITVKAASNMKVPQYMSRGVVPIVSDIGDLPATVDFGNAGYIAKVDNADSLKATLLYALTDADRLRKADNARFFSREKFDWDKLTLSFYQWIA
jgi:glycosyltransferase involved in cell wall biosynthesis